MYRLKELWHHLGAQLPYENWKGELICTFTNTPITQSLNDISERLSCYTFTIVREGWLELTYNSQHLMLEHNDMLISTPGFPLTEIKTSENYQGICLVADEDFLLASPSVHKAMHAAYFPMVKWSEPILKLSETNSQHLQMLMRQIIEYMSFQHSYKEESMQMLFALFLLDLLNAQEKSITSHHFPKRVEEIFFGFIGLLPQNFIAHHDIGFYAGKLCVTTTYLSRIVKNITGRTVVDYINAMLLMEATWLLSTTNMSIAQVADQLQFSDAAAFTHFFSRLKSITPKQYRQKDKNLYFT